MNLPFKPETTVLEIGGGENPIFRPNMDIRPGPTVDIIADLNRPFGHIPDGFTEGIYSSYVIEHISWRNVRNFIKECFRILRPGGTAFFITANLKEQCRVLVEKEDWEDKDICALFGDQNYKGTDWVCNAHFTGFSPKHAIKLFTEAGFSDVTTCPHPNCPTDLIIEAKKGVTVLSEHNKAVSARSTSGMIASGLIESCPYPAGWSDGSCHPVLHKDTEQGTVDCLTPEKWSKQDRQKFYNKDYFDGGKIVGGYANEGYWDYPIHWNTARKIAAYNPESVLELGAARGYILKKLEDSGIRVKGLEVSKHCFHTRAIKDIVTWDITETPWPIDDQSFDLCFSIAVMEHIPEDKIEAITKEIQRTCKRAVHGISFNGDVDDFDKTHTTLKDRKWWSDRLPLKHEVVDKEWLEEGPANPPLGIGDNSVKLNIGSFTTMFHHGWTNIDIHNLHDWADKHKFHFRIFDMTQYIPFPDNFVDLIYTSHFLEHLTYEEGAAFLKECYRVMKPGAIMRTVVPDEKLIQASLDYCIGEFDELNEGCSKAHTKLQKYWALVHSGHKSAYDSQTIELALKEAGFPCIKHMGFRQSLSPKILIETIDMLPTISLYVDAVK
jgi:predicted SAM-dependent methyltransferase